MNIRAWVLTALVLMVPTAASARDDAPEHRGIHVSGEGEVSVKPDRAELSLGVESHDLELKTAEAEVNKVVRAFLALAKTQGVKDEHISTAGVSIHPEYLWDDKLRRQRFNGYRASRQIVVTVQDLERVGDLILGATKASVNQVNPPTLYSSVAKDAGRQALVKAAEDARAKAQLLASTLGVKLGGLRSISAQDNTPSPPVPYKVMAMRAEADQSGNAQMGFATGEIEYKANVTAEFDILP